MFNHLRSNIYKIRKTPLLGLALLWPVLIVGLFIAYYSVATWSTEQKITGYFQTIALVMPCLITSLCAYLAQQEQRAGDCFNILCVGRSRFRTFFSIFILLFVLAAVGVIMSVAGFYFLWGQMQAAAYVLSCILVLIPIACLLLIQLFIALRFGTSWCVALGAIFLLVGALGVTGLLDRLWYYLPPVWAPRFATLMISNFFHSDNIVKVAAELRYGLFFCLVFTLILVILIPSWFHKWDGRPSIGDE